MLMVGILTVGMFPGTPLADAGSTKRITEGHIDSTCIGDVSNPVCAIETWNACYAFERPELCALLGVEGMRFTPDARPNIIEYRIIEVLPVAPERIPRRLRDSPWFIHAQWEIRVMERWCMLNCERLSEDSFEPFVYYLRSEGGEWRLAAWTNDTSVTCENSDVNLAECALYFRDQDSPWVHDQYMNRNF